MTVSSLSEVKRIRMSSSEVNDFVSEVVDGKHTKKNLGVKTCDLAHLDQYDAYMIKHHQDFPVDVEVVYAT